MKRDYIVIDFETTGLQPIMSEVIEIGALRFEDGNVVDRFEVLLKPGRPVEPKAFAAHRLSNEHLAANGRDPEGEWARLHKFMGELPLIAHNGLGFDFQFIYNAFSRFKLAHGPNRLIDTLSLSPTHFQSKTGRFNLGDICTAHAIANKQAHRAMGDVEALAELMKVVFQKTASLEEMWVYCGEFELHGLGDLPRGFESIQQAIEDGMDVQIDYQGKNKPRSQRWIRPLHVQMNQGRRYIVSMCLQDGVEKSFLCDGIRGVLGSRKSG